MGKPKLLVLSLVILCSTLLTIQKTSAQDSKQDDKKEVDITALLQEGEAAIQNEDWAAAAEAYGKVTKENAEIGVAWHFLGYALHLDGKLDEAIKAHTEASSFDDFEAISLYNLGCAHSLKDNKKESIKFLHEALDAGFNEFEMFREDSDLENVRKADGFKSILARAANNGKRPSFDPAKMVSDWKVVKGVRAGKEVPKERLMTITISDSEVTIPAGPEKFVMSYKVNADKTPAQIDMEITAGPAPEGSKAVGLVKFDSGKFVICYDTLGANRPEKFESTEENGFFMFVCERVKDAEEKEEKPKKDAEKDDEKEDEKKEGSDK